MANAMTASAGNAMMRLTARVACRLNSRNDRDCRHLGVVRIQLDPDGPSPSFPWECGTLSRCRRRGRGPIPQVHHCTPDYWLDKPYGEGGIVASDEVAWLAVRRNMWGPASSPSDLNLKSCRDAFVIALVWPLPTLRPSVHLAIPPSPHCRSRIRNPDGIGMERVTCQVAWSRKRHRPWSLMPAVSRAFRWGIELIQIRSLLHRPADFVCRRAMRCGTRSNFWLS